MVMMGGIDQLFSRPAVPEGFREYFHIKVIYHTAEGHQQQVKSQHIDVHREDKEDQRKDQGFYDTFPGVEGEGRPGSGREAVVMYLMHLPEYPGLMHPAVHPIVVSFVKQQRQQ